MKFSALTLLALSLLVSACGGGGGGGGGGGSSKKSPDRQEQEEQEMSEAVGRYKAHLRPMNTRVYGFINSGRADLDLQEQFSVKVVMDDAPGVPHMQGIYTGRNCPDKSADTNKDGYVDIIEAEAVIGKMIIPLDDHLETQTAGTRTYPVGRSYTYNRKANFEKMIKDLTLPDENTSDNVIKLPANGNFSLEGKVIIVHGALESTVFPASVKSRDGLTKAWTMPIACGKLRRVE